MEDDGILLNFAAPSAASTKKAVSKVTGGKWKDRRKLQLSLQGRGRGSNKEKSVASGVNNTKLEKKRPQGGDASAPGPKKRHTTSTGGPSLRSIKFAESGGESGGKNNSYVSSLFTSNEESKLLAQENNDEKSTEAASNAPLDTNSFDGLGLNTRLATHLAESLRFKHPTKVQQAVIPKLALNAVTRDLFVKAQTGSGKTLSFLLPLFHKLMTTPEASRINRELGLFAIILVPTRELATQIYGVMESLTRCYHHIVPGIVIGGEKKKSEKARLRKGVNILVATPGRLADHMENTETFNVSQLRWLILDEGDKLMELGFEETITKIITKIDDESKIYETKLKWNNLPHKRVNVLCSATMQGNVKKLGGIVLNNAEMINIERDGPVGTTEFNTDFEKPITGDDGKEIDIQSMHAPDQLIQKVVVVPPKLRLVTLSALLKRIVKTENSELNTRTIVFFSCSDSVDFHFDTFTRGGRQFKKIRNQETDKYEVEMIPYDKDDAEKDETASVLTAPILGSNNVIIHKLHGSLSQQIRTSTLQSFVKGKFPNGREESADMVVSKHSILFCTDVASRGLDLPSVSQVIEFDPPFTIEDHLHRIGRTARVGREGEATLFLLPGNEEAYVEGKLKIVHPKSSNLRIIGYENILKEGFSDNSSSASTAKKDPKHKDGKWDVHATTWHLDVERWLLEDQSAHDLAVQAFTSHIRAYATHLSTERQFFNIKLLHLGHLAKSFGLRETPKKLGKSVGTNTTIQEGIQPRRKNEDPRKKMLRMAKMAVNSNSDEFNY